MIVRKWSDPRWPPLLVGAVFAPSAWVAAQPAGEPASSAQTVRSDPEPSAASTAQLPGSRPAAQGATNASSGIGWNIAPIRWDGVLTLESRWSTLGDQARQHTQIGLLSLRAASYIWQPWFVQISGGLSLGLTRSASSSGLDSSSLESSTSTSSARAVNATLGVLVFPQSRFPFSGTWTTNDSRTSDTLTSIDSRSQRISLRQGYRTETGNTSYSALYDRSEITGDGFGRDRVDVIQGTVTHRFKDQQIDGTLLRSQNERSKDGGGSSSTRVSVLHSYRPDEDLFVASSLSDSSTRLKFGLGDAQVQNRLRFRQFNTLATWTPEFTDGLLVTGALRWADSANESRDASQASTSSTSSYSATTTANWRPIRNLQLGASINLSQSRFENLSQTQGSESLSVGYQIDPRQFAGISYMAGANTSVTHLHGGREGNRVAFAQGANQSVMRNFPLSESLGVGVSMSQSVSLRQDNVVGNLQTLAHNAGLNLRYMTSDGMTGYASLSASDSRTSGVTPAHFQMLNLQMSGSIPFNRYSSASANFTAQMVRQALELEPGVKTDEGWRRFMTGGFSYQHSRVFGVPRLRYTALANAFNSQVSARISGDPNAPLESVQWTHEQRLEYLIGRLDVRLSARLTKVDGKKNALLFLRVSRGFGAF